MNAEGRLLSVHPTSEAALKKEEKFLKKVAKRIYGTTSPSDKAPAATETNVSETEACDIKLPSEISKLECLDINATHVTEVSHNEQHDGMSATQAPAANVATSQSLATTGQPSSATGQSHAGTGQPSAIGPNKESGTLRPTSLKKNVPSPRFVGVYVGTNGAVVSPCSDAELWSVRYSPIKSDDATASAAAPENIIQVNAINHDIASIFYGSYAYKQSAFLLNLGLFAGYDHPLSRLFRIGLEIQGNVGWRDSEITSNGVYGQRSDKSPLKTITFNGQTGMEVDLAYTRQTMSHPYACSLLPRVGILLSHGTMLFTRFGVECTNIKIMDHPEASNDIKKNPKHDSDTIFNGHKAAIVAGIGVEATINNQIFLRIECSYSKGKNIAIKQDVLQSTPDERTLEEFNVTPRQVTFGFGAGIRF
jgi:opacity protein-like surface antigen